MRTVLGIFSALTLLGFMAGMVWNVLIWAGLIKNRTQRGFEVKLTTGETPVLRERENDHG
jgi:hypothetical protein